MNRRLLALCTASALALATPLTAQVGVQYDEKETTISGCLQKNKSGGFWLTNGMVESAGAKSGVDPTERARATTGDKDVRRATREGLWNLENGKDLDRYLNQEIEVTGRAKKETSGDQLKGMKGYELQARDFDVKSVTRIASSCR